MKDDEFDAALIAAAFALGADAGWKRVSAAAAAQRAGLDLAVARTRFATPGKILGGFGRLADIHALNGALAEGAARERLFDIVLRRFDFLQMHRAGVLALIKTLPLEPVWAFFLAAETVKSMGWILEAAGVPLTGVRGEIAKQGLAAVWAWGLRAWAKDETFDLTVTMAAVDVALNRAEQLAQQLMPPAPAEDDPAAAPFADPADMTATPPEDPPTAV